MLAQLLDNPIFARSRQVERRRNGSLARLVLCYGGSLLLVSGSIILMLLLFAVNDCGQGGWAGVREAVLSSGVLASVLMPVYLIVRGLNGTFGALTLERERQTYDSLLGSRLSGREIAAGKMLSAVWPVWRELALAAPLILALGWFGGVPAATVAHLVLGAASVPFAAALGLWASARSQSTQQANRTASMLTLGLFFGGPILGLGLEIANHHEHSLRDLAYMTSPLVSSVSLCQNQQSWLLPSCLNLAIFTLAGIWFYASACRRLRRA